MLRLIARINVGGPALQVTALTQRLDPARFETRLLTGAVDTDEADYASLRARDLRYETVPGLGRSVHAFGDARALAFVSAAIREYRPHIVHTHTAKAGVIGRIAANLRGTPITVHTYHGHLLSGYFPGVITTGIVATERALATRTTRLVSVGSQVRDDLIAAGVGSRDKFQVVAPGVVEHEPVGQAAARLRLGLPMSGQLVAFVARQTKIKRPDRFLEVVSLVSRARPQVHFVVAGGGELLEQTKAAATQHRLPITFLGWCADLPGVYSAADLVVLTSDSEGMPVTLIEAAMMGKPAVTTDVGSASEVVLHGISGLVTPTDPHDLATATLRLLDEESLRLAMGRAAATHAKANFSERRLVADTATMYEQLAKQRDL